MSTVSDIYAQAVQLQPLSLHQPPAEKSAEGSDCKQWLPSHVPVTWRVTKDSTGTCHNHSGVEIDPRAAPACGPFMRPTVLSKLPHVSICLPQKVGQA